ncbi:uncharacterized protein LOC129694503 [Leucoraja erinacea]|uniref:uncharacterized protein LOC129694503 n=1 Tax=Leucoraja erinaceus TaxID=7782 RepID=UPI0024540E7B|nr:uncharacterized protein LOC129694503 [Leucoraja erinacea]
MAACNLLACLLAKSTATVASPHSLLSHFGASPAVAATDSYLRSGHPPATTTDYVDPRLNTPGSWAQSQTEFAEGPRPESPVSAAPNPATRSKIKTRSSQIPVSKSPVPSLNPRRRSHSGETTRTTVVPSVPSAPPAGRPPPYSPGAPQSTDSVGGRTKLNPRNKNKKNMAQRRTQSPSSSTFSTSDDNNEWESEGDTASEDRDERREEEARRARKKKHYPRARQMPMRTVPNPAAAGVAVVAGGPPATIQVYAPWKPNDMLIILNGAPDKVKCPGRFVEFIGNMLDAYQAVSLDAWSLVRQSLNRTQWGKFLAQLGYNNHAAMEAVHPGVAGDEQRKTLLLAALEATLRKPIDLPKVLDQKPKRNEDPEDFLERFKDVYGSHAGDQNFNTGQQSPQFCATLMLCLPDGVGTSVKTNNLNWTGMNTPDMCRAVCALWKRGEAGDPPAKVKTEYVITREQPPKPKGPPHAETRGYQKEHQSCVPVTYAEIVQAIISKEKDEEVREDTQTRDNTDSLDSKANKDPEEGTQMLSISPTRRNDSIPEPHLKMTVNNESHSFLVDTGATVSSVQCSLALQTTGQHEMLQGFDGIPHPYPLTVPVPVQYEGIRIMHQFVVTNNLDINVLGRDLLCRLQLLLVCQPHSIEVEHAQHRQCYQHRTPQWWSLDLEDQEHHVTLAYDASGSNSELEQFFGPHEGSQWTITELATVTGREGEALAVSISMSNWRQSPGIAPHLTLKVYFPYTAKDLGPMVFQALKGSDENTQGPQQVTSDLSITYSPTRPTQEGTLRHHKGRDIVEFTDPEVWADDQTQVGLTNVEPVLVKVKPGVAMPSIQQYPLKVQAVPCIDVLLKGLLKQGILITCQSCCNTPILAVPKPGKPNQYRLVQDLRAINAIVQPLHALVPNPAHILATIPAKATVFGSVDLQHAFFSIPLHPDCQYLFAFTYNGQQYTWTRLPQGFVNSPTLFSRCLQQQLQNLQLPEGSALIQYVDDLLVASETEEQNREAIILLLNFVKTLGYVVSPSKVHVGQKEVKFLGVIISAEGRRLDESRTDPIYRTAPPTSARGMRQWLGMINYCRQWIPNVALDIKHLTPYTSEESTFVLSGEALTAFNNLREALQKAPALGRPLYDRPFQLYCTVLGECATAVLTQLHGDKHRPVAYYSSKLDPVALGYPHCTQVLTAVYNSLQSAANLTLQQDITVYSSHSVTALLGQLQTQHLTSARQNKYEIYLLNNPKLQFRHCTTINPAAFLCSPPHLLAPCDHNCLEAILADTSPRPDLSDQPLASPDLILYTDGSSSINEQGRRLSGFAVVKQDGTLLDCGSFDPPFSAQQAELFALTRACVLAEGHSVNIYTDSRYAFGVVHDFGQLWKNRGFLTSTGHKIANQILVSDLLNAILLPSAVAVIKCAAHTTGESPVQIGNRLADDAAKCASRGRFKVGG